LKEKLIKIGAKVVSHGRYLPSGRPRSPCRGRCSRTSCRLSPGCVCRQRQHETLASHVVKSTRPEECVQMPRKMHRSAPPTTFRAAGGVVSRLRPAAAFAEGRKSQIIDAGPRVIREIPANNDGPGLSMAAHRGNISPERRITRGMSA
jgi:hypothetical protein